MNIYNVQRRAVHALSRLFRRVSLTLPDLFYNRQMAPRWRATAMLLEVGRPTSDHRSNGATSVPMTGFSQASGSAECCGTMMKNFVQTHAVRLVIDEALEISSACFGHTMYM